MYHRPELWAGVVLLLASLACTYVYFSDYNQNEWDSLTDSEQSWLKWTRSSQGKGTLLLLWAATGVCLYRCLRRQQQYDG